MKCQEPGCGFDASKDYNGLIVCNSHWKHYIYQQEQQEYELKSMRW